MPGLRYSDMPIKNNEIITYWIKSADKDYQAMTNLFEKGDYTWSLFVGHLLIEKLLKAVYALKKPETPPFMHDLLRLAEKCRLDLDENQKDILDTITTFNIRARYDDYKMEFHNKCTKDFTEEWINHIKEIRIWLKERHLSLS